MFDRTQQALSQFNGSPVTKHRKVNNFLVEQLGLTNAHTLPTLFAPTSTETTGMNERSEEQVGHDTLDGLFGAIEGATSTLDDGIDVYRTLCRALLVEQSPAALKNILTTHLDPFETDVQDDEKIFSESNAEAERVLAYGEALNANGIEACGHQATIEAGDVTTFLKHHAPDLLGRL